MSWITRDEAARALATSPANVAVIAHRRGWRRRQRPNWRETEYHAEDVADECLRRAEAVVAIPTRGV